MILPRVQPLLLGQSAQGIHVGDDKSASGEAADDAPFLERMDAAHQRGSVYAESVGKFLLGDAGTEAFRTVTFRSALHPAGKLNEGGVRPGVGERFVHLKISARKGTHDVYDEFRT